MSCSALSWQGPGAVRLMRSPVYRICRKTPSAGWFKQVTQSPVRSRDQAEDFTADYADVADAEWNQETEDGCNLETESRKADSFLNSIPWFRLQILSV